VDDHEHIHLLSPKRSAIASWVTKEQSGIAGLLFFYNAISRDEEIQLDQTARRSSETQSVMNRSAISTDGQDPDKFPIPIALFILKPIEI